MKSNIWNIGLIATAAIFGLSACGQEAPDKTGDEVTETAADGEVKQVDGKADAWNWRNDPGLLRTEFEYNFDALPTEGQTNTTPWTASYWPYYHDGLNHRWQEGVAMDEESGWRGLSPAEKYDIAFNDWSPTEGFSELEPFNNETCEFDQAYYDALGPAAVWTHRNKGLGVMTDGRDGDGDGVADADECKQNLDAEKTDFDGIETWWGICHAWAPAALVEEQPLSAVTRNGVTFDVSDMKGLIIQQWDRMGAIGVGGRCNEEELERDENGRVIKDECRDLNPGSWHVIVTNFIGMNKKGIVIERTTNYEIWNQPLFGYTIDEQREISLQETLQLLKIDDDAQAELPQGNGTFINEVEEESADALALLEFVNQASFDELDIDAGLRSNAVESIIAHRDGPDATPGTSDDDLFETLAELDKVKFVGTSAFGRMLGFALSNGFGPANNIEYKYNVDAERFVEVRMHTDWITEQFQSADRTDDIIDRYTRHDHYHYILELDADGEIIGGEWVGDSNLNHPDFVWTPIRAVSGNPHIEIDVVRDLIEESRRNVLGDEEEEDTQSLTFESTGAVAIPDFDPNGAVSTIEIDETGTVKGISLDLDIEHTYRGDLLVELRHGGIKVTVFDGATVEQPWDDNVTLEGHVINGFEGANLSGDWELVVFDTFKADTGQIVDWKLTFEAAQ